jgi:hypothetical protein
LGLSFLITGNLNAEGLQKLGAVECIPLRLKLACSWRQLLCLADGTRNIEARHICHAASASAIFASLIGTHCGTNAASNEACSDYCCGYE